MAYKLPLDYTQESMNTCVERIVSGMNFTHNDASIINQYTKEKLERLQLEIVQAMAFIVDAELNDETGKLDPNVVIDIPTVDQANRIITRAKKQIKRLRNFLSNHNPGSINNTNNSNNDNDNDSDSGMEDDCISDNESTSRSSTSSTNDDCNMEIYAKRLNFNQYCKSVVNNEKDMLWGNKKRIPSIVNALKNVCNFLFVKMLSMFLILFFFFLSFLFFFFFTIDIEIIL